MIIFFFSAAAKKLTTEDIDTQIKKEEEQLSKVAIIIPPKPIATAVIMVRRINATLIAVMDQYWNAPLARAFIRLSFSVYVINYTFIRWDFFTSRVHNEVVPAPFHLLTKRLWYTYILTFVAAYAFHVVIFAPLDNLRRRFTTSAVQDKEQKQE